MIQFGDAAKNRIVPVGESMVQKAVDSKYLKELKTKELFSGKKGEAISSLGYFGEGLVLVGLEKTATPDEVRRAVYLGIEEIKKAKETEVLIDVALFPKNKNTFRAILEGALFSSYERIKLIKDWKPREAVKVVIRTGESEGVDYYFLSDERFRQLREEDGFIECVEVYPGRFYGTLRSELTRIAQIGKNLLLDIDVEGAIRIKEQFGEAALAIFLQPPSLEVLRQRLTNRATDSAESIEHRLSRAAYELSLASHFDITIVNDQLEKAVDEVAEAIHRFIQKA